MKLKKSLFSKEMCQFFICSVYFCLSKNHHIVFNSIILLGLSAAEPLRWSRSRISEGAADRWLHVNATWSRSSAWSRSSVQFGRQRGKTPSAACWKIAQGGNVAYDGGVNPSGDLTLWHFITCGKKASDVKEEKKHDISACMGPVCVWGAVLKSPGASILSARTHESRGWRHILHQWQIQTRELSIRWTEPNEGGCREGWTLNHLLPDTLLGLVFHRKSVTKVLRTFKVSG